ncbi:50S ribosomal protein L3 [Patescibacteria group bacterium]|nr:50S ribosomal protein L3 [Patescibacteria group bacterium]
MKFILGKKLEMSQLFDERGNVVPVTVIEAGPCFVTQIKNKKKDGYEATQIGFERIEKKKKIKKPQTQKPFRYLREFSAKGVLLADEQGSAADGQNSKYKVGDKIDISIFQAGDMVKVSGISKGKGFQGAVKRWGFAGRGASHGVKHEARTLGSVGSSFPERVIKGKKMPGRMGFERITVKNLEIVKIDAKNNLIAMKGAIPGRRGTLLEIRG